MNILKYLIISVLMILMTYNTSYATNVTPPNWEEEEQLLLEESEYVSKSDENNKINYDDVKKEEYSNTLNKIVSFLSVALGSIGIVYTVILTLMFTWTRYISFTSLMQRAVTVMTFGQVDSETKITKIVLIGILISMVSVTLLNGEVQNTFIKVLNKFLNL